MNSKFAILLFLSLLSEFVFCESIQISSVDEFVSLGLKNDPIIAEARLTKLVKEQEYNSLAHIAILPKFELSFMFGPAPNLIVGTQKKVIGSDTVTKQTSEWDFSNMGHYFGTELEVVQALNLNRLRAGQRASRADGALRNAEISKKEIDKAAELQNVYYGFLYAQKMLNLALSTKKRLDQIEKDLVEKLAAEDESVSQSDLFELQASKFEVDDGILQASDGLKKAKLAMSFSLQNGTDSLIFKETDLTIRLDSIPPLDVLIEQLPLLNPEMLQLQSGLQARRALVEVTASEISPQVFLFGQFRFTKSWTPDRKNSVTDNVFANDPLNNVTGVVGLGVKFNLNVWSTYDRLERARLDVKLLKAKEKYAQSGLGLKLEESYNSVISNKKRIIAAKTALEASESWVKASALQFDLDPSAGAMLLRSWIKNTGNQKVYYKTIYDYNLAVSDLYSKFGILNTETAEKFRTK